jgi:hypothetical protein
MRGEGVTKGEVELFRNAVEQVCGGVGCFSGCGGVGSYAGWVVLAFTPEDVEEGVVGRKSIMEM